MPTNFKLENPLLETINEEMEIFYQINLIIIKYYTIIQELIVMIVLLHYQLIIIIKVKREKERKNDLQLLSKQNENKNKNKIK